MVIVSIGDQDEGLEYYPSLIAEKIPYVIVNQLTKEPRFWKIREHKTLPVTLGYINAKTTFFTCLNNRDVMEKRLDTVLSNSDIHFNPYHIDRHKVPTYPSISEGYKIAIPSKESPTELNIGQGTALMPKFGRIKYLNLQEQIIKNVKTFC